MLGLLVAPRLGVLKVFPCQDDLTAQQQGPSVAIGIAFQAEGYRAGIEGRHGAGRVVDHANFKCSRAAQDFLGLGDILHARQLHDDAVGALLLDDGFGHTQLVDTVVQGGDVLLERIGLYLGDGGLRQLAGEGVASAFATAGREGHVGQRATQLGRRGVARVRAIEAGDDGHVVAFDAARGDFRLAQRSAHIVGQGIIAARQGALHVDLQQEVNPAAQIEAQIHGVGPQGGQPVRRSRQQVEGYGITRVTRIRVQGFFNEVFGLQLDISALKADPHGAYRAVLFIEGACGRDVVGLEQLFHTPENAIVDFDRRFGRRYLDSGRLPKKIR